jgi:hypothetical protein
MPFLAHAEKKYVARGSEYNPPAILNYFISLPTLLLVVETENTNATATRRHRRLPFRRPPVAPVGAVRSAAWARSTSSSAPCVTTSGSMHHGQPLSLTIAGRLLLRCTLAVLFLPQRTGGLVFISWSRFEGSHPRDRFHHFCACSIGSFHSFNNSETHFIIVELCFRPAQFAAARSNF